MDVGYCYRFFAVPTGVYYRYPQSGPGAVIERLDKSGDVSGLASRHGDSTWRAGGTYEKIPETGILSPEITPEISRSEVRRDEHAMESTHASLWTVHGALTSTNSELTRHPLSSLTLK